MTMLATILAVAADNQELIGIGAAGVAMWLRLEHRLTKLETTVRLLVTKKAEAETAT